MGEQQEQVLVLVPTYDERATIPLLLRRLRSTGPVYRVLVIDDSSPDGTAGIVRSIAAGDEALEVLDRPGKEGLGAAYRAGYGAALERSAGIVCQMDADLSHDPDVLPALVRAVAEGADLAIGSRYIRGGGVQGWSWHRIRLSRMANRFVRLATGCPVRDATAGFRAYRASALTRIGVMQTTSSGYAFQIEMTLRACEQGLQIVEVPIDFVERRNGKSKLSSGVVGEAFRSVFRWGWRLRRGYPLTVAQPTSCIDCWTPPRAETPGAPPGPPSMG